MHVWGANGRLVVVVGLGLLLLLLLLLRLLLRVRVRVAKLRLVRVLVAQLGLALVDIQGLLASDGVVEAVDIRLHHSHRLHAVDLLLLVIQGLVGLLELSLVMAVEV